MHATESVGHGELWAQGRSMTWLLVVGTGWLLLSVAAGLLVGGAIALEDGEAQVACEKGPWMANVRPGP